MITSTNIYQGFRNPEVIKALAEQIRVEAGELQAPLHIMEVCGGHTHTIMKFGLKQLLPNNLSFVHGPGCPVCIMPKERIDHAVEMAMMQDVILVCLGDMIRVPGSTLSLAQCRAQGGNVVPVYDPMDALKIASDNPNSKVVYFAIGFETTTPMTAVLVQQAEKRGLNNLYFHINHVLVPPAMHAVMADSRTPVNAFIGPSHVSAVSGSDIYLPIVEQHQTPIVVAGFEPVDVLESVLMLVRQAVSGEAKLENQYTRVVTHGGNQLARKMVEQVFQVRDSFTWRGLGDIPRSALALCDDYAHRDAERQFEFSTQHPTRGEHKACRCTDILRGLATPTDCKMFGRACNPNRPMGSCMVSSEGACNAYYRYGGISINTATEECVL